VDVSRRIAVAFAATMALAAGAAPAGAASHEYCLWSGSYYSSPAGDLCYAQGENWLTNNHAYLPYQPVNPTIYCGANKNGAQYASFTGGNPGCYHVYSGGNLLKATLFVNITATVHGDITW
jgi:hypothetical protein